jgi:hypothetical protein
LLHALCNCGLDELDWMVEEALWAVEAHPKVGLEVTTGLAAGAEGHLPAPDLMMRSNEADG